MGAEFDWCGSNWHVCVERFCTALAIRNMNPEVLHEWANDIKGHDGIPPINVFKDFLTEQNENSTSWN